MALGRIAVHDIASTNTNEELHDFSEASTVDLTVCNRGSSAATFRVAIVDGALGDVANEDYVYYDDTLAGNESRSLLVREPISANELILVRASTTDVSFRLSGEGS